MKYIYYVFVDVNKMDDGNNVGISLRISNYFGKNLSAERTVFDSASYEQFANSEECSHKILQSTISAFIDDQFPQNKIKNIIEQTKDLRFYAYKSDNNFYVDLANRYNNLSSNMERQMSFVMAVAQHVPLIADEIRNNDQIKIYYTDISKVSVSNIEQIIEKLPMFKFTMTNIDVNVLSETEFNQVVKIEIIEFE